MKKKPVNVDEFDALTPEEQEQVLREIRDGFGDQVIHVRMFTSQPVKDWWENMSEDGRLAFEMLMSNFFLSCIKVAVNEGPTKFTEKTAVAQMVLSKPLTYRDGKIIVGDLGSDSGSTQCDGDCNPCTCDECTDYNGGRDDDKGKTYH